MVLFTSAIVVGALLLLGAALNALLAKSLYTQQSADAVQQVKQLTRQNELGDVTGFDTKQVQTKLQEQLTSGQSGQLSFQAVVLNDADGTETFSNGNYRFRHVPTGLAERVLRGELAYVYIRSPVGPGRMLVVGAPISIDQSESAPSRRTSSTR